MNSFTELDYYVINDSLTEQEHLKSPFIHERLMKVDDINTTGNYSSGQVVFKVLASNSDGMHADYKNGFINIPMVAAVEGAAADGSSPVNFTSFSSDFMLGLKNGYSFIDSYTIDIGNGEVVSKHELSNMYINFKLNTEMSHMEEKLDGELINYKRDTSTSWTYQNNASVYGRGMCNNANSNYNYFSLANDTEPNEGMLARQRKFRNVNKKEGASLVLDGQQLSDSCDNRVVDAAGYKLIHFNAIIRLKDLLFFSQMPLCADAIVKITLNINQSFFEFTKAADGKLNIDPDTIIVNGGFRTNPLMVAAVAMKSRIVNMKKTANGAAVADPHAVTYETNNVTEAEAFTPCGSSTLKTGKTYKCSLSIVQTRFGNHKQDVRDNAKHTLSNCALYVPLYQFKPDSDSSYLANPERVIRYHNVVYNEKLDIISGKSINFIVHPGLVNPIRLIICPLISSSANGSENGTAFSELRSPFSSAPGNISPYSLQNFNVKLSGKNLFDENFKYDYEMFTQNTGKVSNLSLTDFNNTYGYIVVDLRKRKDLIDQQQSIEIVGLNKTKKAIDLHCFIEYEASVVLNTVTGIVTKAS